jgi:hypothetical protein
VRWLLLLVIASCQSSDVSRDVGARCDTNADCDQKCEPPTSDWPGGFCTVLCDSDASCPSDTRCVEEDGGVCEFSCVADPDCVFLGDGYGCKQHDSHGGGAKVMVCRGS